MAGAPCPLPHALHANLLVMDELGGAVLRRSDGLHQREELCLDARTGRCDHHLLGGPQRQSSALRVEGQGRRYPAQNRRRQTRARRWPCPMQLYFRYITLGSMARYWMGIRITVLAGLAFPWATILINILGSLVIGFLATFTGPEGRLPAPLDARALLIVGLCGGFTTFSAFSLQTLDLARDGRLLLGGQYRAFRRAVSRRRRPRSLACHAFRQSMSAFRS